MMFLKCCFCWYFGVGYDFDYIFEGGLLEFKEKWKMTWQIWQISFRFVSLSLREKDDGGRPLVVFSAVIIFHALI